tara:strand:- start:123 stop:284 length:162 start_codon:yes stop_codon:yes gene_type:complete
MRIFSTYLQITVHTLSKLKSLKLTLLGAFGSGVVVTSIAKDMSKKKKTEDIAD